MALALKALHTSFAVHFLAVVGAILVLIWCISFRGGLAWDSSDKSLIFNVNPLIPFSTLSSRFFFTKICLWFVFDLSIIINLGILFSSGVGVKNDFLVFF